jgi:hypothetical protein
VTRNGAGVIGREDVEERVTDVPTTKEDL